MKVRKNSPFIQILCALLCIAGCFSNLSAQTIFGLVREADRGTGLPGATLELLPERGTSAILTTRTDTLGAFRFEGLRPGYYRCRVSAMGFEPRLITQINVAAGKEQYLEIDLWPSATALPDVTVTARAPNLLAPRDLSEIPLTREQTLRFPATFFDPARLAMAYPGVAGANDQANGLSIRGNNPNALRWRVDGVDVVNPNHLTNAGTFTDRPALASGGVLLFSAQLLDNSTLLTGAFPAGYGDALGGVMDIALRRGNPNRHEFTAQAGLIGLDLAAEGPLGRPGRHSYLANYRYSTVGLLSQMGVPLGDEAINFQDLSFKVSFSGKNGSQWSVFGVGGINETLFERKDSADVKTYKDLFDIEFYSRTGILGLSNLRPTRRGWLKFSAVWSGQKNERRAEGAGQLETDEQKEQRLGILLHTSQKITGRQRLRGGMQLQLQQFVLSGKLHDTERQAGSLDAGLAQAWLNWEWESADGATSAQAGIHTSSFVRFHRSSTQPNVLEPRLLLGRRLGDHHRLDAQFGWYSQLPPGWLLTDRESARGANRRLGFIRSRQLSLRYRYQPGEVWTYKAEAFFQDLYDVPVSATRRDAFSLLNVSEMQVLDTLAADGKGRNLGLELGAERYLRDGWFLLANLTLLDAQTRGSDGVWRAGRWNARYIANLTAGKEWQRDKRPGRTRTFGLNGRATLNGGFREMPIDRTASAFSNTTVFDETAGFSVQQPAFFRLDLRLYWKRSLGNRRNSTFALDFQNATLGNNVAYRYWDAYTRAAETKYQLPLIPNMSWRMEF